MSISAQTVKELRERTGAGMMECKKALTETNGDIEAAIEFMRKSGMAKADKKASRVAAEGQIIIEIDAQKKHGVMVEVNCETDFVANGDDFKSFAQQVGKVTLESKPADVDALGKLPLKKGEPSVDDTRRALIAKLGENISVRRFKLFSTSTGLIGSYRHGTRIGVVVVMNGGSEDLARDVAMHIAASRPLCVSEKDMPADVVAKEREIYMAQAAESGKPQNIIEKMVDGRVKKYIAEVTLLGQPFVKNPETTIEQLLKKSNATVVEFQRIEVGEGIEKKTGDFAAEVMATVRGS